MSVALFQKKIKSFPVIIAKITTASSVSISTLTYHRSESTHFIKIALSLFTILIPLNKKNLEKVGFALAVINNVSVCPAKAILLWL
jgi:hypothetical protein